jgi:hypothetical protein
MDKIKQLYDSFLSNNIISSNTDFETFKSANEEQLKSLYDVAVKNKVLSSATDFNMFSSAWSLKKKDELQVTSPTVPTESVTEVETTPILSEPLENELVNKLSEYNIPALNEEGVKEFQRNVNFGVAPPKNRTEANIQSQLPVDEYGVKYDPSERFKIVKDPEGKLVTRDSRDNVLADAINTYQKATKTVEIDNGIAEDYTPTITSEKLTEVNADINDYAAWEKKNIRQETGAYKFFKNLLTSDEGALFEKEQSEYQKLSAYQADKLNKIANAVETYDAKAKLATNTKERDEAIALSNDLKQRYREEANKTQLLLDKFPKLKELSSDREQRLKMYNDMMMGEAVGGVTGASVKAASLGRNTVKSAANIVADFAMNTMAAIPAFIDSAVSGDKGVLAGITDMFLDSAEHFSQGTKAVNRPTFLNGKEVRHNGRDYLVSEDGNIYDRDSHILVSDIIDETTASKVKELAQGVKAETNFSPGAGVEGTGAQVANLFALIRGAGIIKGATKLPGGASMGVASYASQMAGTVDEIKGQLLDAGLSEQEATDKAFYYGNAIASLDGVFSGLAGSNANLIPTVSTIKQSIIDLAKTEGKDFTKKQFKDKVKDLVNENLKEVFIEELPVLFSEKAISSMLNKSVGLTVRADKATKEEILETIFLTAAATTALGSTRLLDVKTRQQMLNYVAQQTTDYEQISNKLVKEGLITNEEGSAIISELKAYRKADTDVQGTIQMPENKLEASDLISKKKELLEKASALDPSLREDIDAQIQEIDTKIKQIKEKDKQDAIQEQETRDIPTVESTEGVQEMETEVREPSLEETEEIADKAGVTPKNLRDLYNIGREMFGLNKVQAFAQAVTMDRMVGAMAKRRGVKKADIYKTIEFRKASEKDIPQGVKFQVDAWHGSPYQFDKFTTEAIGTGEGAQAVGWGLYFTDLESIAKNYAEKLAKSKMTILTDGKKINLDSETFTNAEEIAYGTLEIDYTIEKAIKRLEYNQTKRPNDDNLKAIDILKRTKVEGSRNIYKVSIQKGKKPSEYTWLEWDRNIDKKLAFNLLKKAGYVTENDNFAKKQSELLGSIENVSNEDKINEVLDEIDNLNDEYIKNEIKDFTNDDFYLLLTEQLGGAKQASLFLLENGIDGVKYPAESFSRGATSDTARGFNYVVFDENAVSIEEVIKFQKDAIKARGAMMMNLDGQAIIYALTDPNVSTPLHEMAHVFEHYLTDTERKAIVSWAGTKGWTIETSEKFARGFEKYLAEGKAPTTTLQKLFDRFKEWLTDIYNGIKGSDIDIELNDKMKSIYDSMLDTEQTIAEETKLKIQDETRQQAGDRAGSDTSRKNTSLEGAPIIQGATGPDANLVKVAEKYAADNGIDIKRQSEYVVVDEERAKRIADAYEQMANDPQNPKVKEAYEDLIRQTKAQYDALVDAGYEFTFFDDQTDPYNGNPYNAMRDLRSNKKMAVYGTFAGYGTEGITDSEVENNPMLADTGLKWKDQNGNEQIVTANDLFRAVHDAFGHGLEGSGFRARGEENAWQAHIRLFKGPAVAALTSETRGQNSWLNYGPFGEANRTAKVGDTVFAEQKVGLMPEFTWKEGLAPDMKTEAGIDNLKENFKGKPSIDEVYKYSVDNGISLKETRDFLESEGYTKKEISDYVKKEEKVFEKKGNKILNTIQKIKRKLLSAKAFLSVNVFKALETKNSFIAADVRAAERTAKKLRRLMKNQLDSMYEQVDNLMRGKEHKGIPENIQVLAATMRQHLDSMSEALIKSGAVKSEESIQNIKDNMGIYMNRSYQLFDNKNWKENVSEQIIDEAKQYLKNNFKVDNVEELAKENNVTVDEYINTRVNQIVDDILNSNEANEFVSVATQGSKNLKVLKQRKEIPPQIRALMGEYTDPAYNYVMSVAKISSIVQNQKFLEKVKDIGEGVFMFKESDINRPIGDERYVRLSAEGNESLSPIDGYFMPKEMAEQFKKGIKILDIKSKDFERIYSYWLTAVGSVKYAKTILSIGTHSKNVLGNLYFMAQNGYLDPKEYNDALKTLRNEFTRGENESLNQKMDEYIRSGIINQSVTLNEVKNMMKGDDSFDIRLSKRIQGKSESIIDKGKQSLKKIGEAAETAYQAEDDFFKIVAYEKEKSDYSKILFNKSYDKLTQDQQDVVKRKVSENVKNILPNYSRVGGLAKGLRGFPVAGTFISFQMEAWRTAYNTIALAADELKSDNPKMRDKGAKRMASIIGFQAIKYGIMYIAQGMLLGDEEDEEDIDVKTIRPFLPSWAKNSDLLITSAGEGKFRYVNMSASDPYGGIVSAINALSRGENVQEGMIQSFLEVAEPILSPDIFLAMTTQLLNNQNSFGAKIYEETDTPFEVGLNISDHIFKVFEPGTITSARKIFKRESSQERFYETVGQFSGFKPHEVEVEKIAFFNLRDLKENKLDPQNKRVSKEKRMLEETKQGLSKLMFDKEFTQLKRDEKVEVEKAMFDKLYETINKTSEKKEKYLKEAHDMFNSATRLGADPTRINRTMKNLQFKKQDRLKIIFGDFSNQSNTD